MHLPLRAEEHLNVFIREKIGRTVRAVNDPNLPLMRVPGNEADRERRSQRRGSVALPDVQHVAKSERPPAVPTEISEREGRAAAEVTRHLQTAAHRKIR